MTILETDITSSPARFDPGEGESRTGGIDLSIIIVSWNVRRHLRACLDSIRRHRGDLNLEVLVIDNASEDGSAGMIERDYPWVTLLRNQENTGFARANNRGLSRARGRYLLLLNPDTEVHPECLQRTIEHAERHEHLGVIGCRVLRPDGSQQSTLFRCPRVRDVLINVFIPNRLMRKWGLGGRVRPGAVEFDRAQSAEVVAGCFMLLRSEVYAQAGGMDEGFFMYGEEAEWCHRIGRCGWGVGYFPGASILHHGGVSTEQCPDQMSLAMARSQLLLIKRTRGRTVAAFANALMLLRDGLRLLGLSLYAPLAGCDRTPLRDTLRQTAARFGLHARYAFRRDWDS